MTLQAHVSSKLVVPTFLAPGTSSVEDNFFTDQRWGIISEWFKHIIFIAHFISIIIT